MATIQRAWLVFVPYLLMMIDVVVSAPKLSLPVILETVLRSSFMALLSFDFWGILAVVEGAEVEIKHNGRVYLARPKGNGALKVVDTAGIKLFSILILVHFLSYILYSKVPQLPEIDGRWFLLKLVWVVGNLSFALWLVRNQPSAEEDLDPGEHAEAEVSTHD